MSIDEPCAVDFVGAEPTIDSEDSEDVAISEAREYTIDELAAETRVPSRTIRYYQSKGALQKPEIRGRKAVYSEAHRERLRLIGLLQDRGLRIKAIRDLMLRVDAGELDLDEWLGLEARIQARWQVDQPKLYAADELREMVGEGRVGVIADLVRLGVVERQGESFLAASPTILRAFLAMEAAGIELEVAQSAANIARKHLTKLSYELGEHYARHVGEGFGHSASPGDLAEAYDASRDIGQSVVHTIFGQEMEKVLRAFVESGRAASLANRRR